MWNPGVTPVMSPTPVPETAGTQEGGNGTENFDGPENSGDGQETSGEPGNETLGDGTIETGEPSGTPTPTLEPTPSTGWIEYDDDWWDAQMGEASGGYDDFYE